MGEGLVAGLEVTFDHGADDRGVAGGDLLHDRFEYFGLYLRVLGGICVGAIDQDGGNQAGLTEDRFGLSDMLGGIVGTSGAATQDDVAVGGYHA